MAGTAEARRLLGDAIRGPLGALATSTLNAGDPGELSTALDEARPELERLKADLGPADVRAVFDDYWLLGRRLYAPYFEQGASADALRDLLWRWLDTGELPQAERAREGTIVGRPVRPVTIPDLSGASYVYVETVRAVVPDQGDFEYTQLLSDRLFAERGYGFGGVVLDDLGRALTPRWIAAESVSVSPDRRRLAVGATVAHEALGLPPALDLGARDGRAAAWRGKAPEGLSVLPDRSLFLGDLDEGWLEMSEVAGSVCSVDTSPDGATLGLLELWAGVGAVSVADARTGERRLLTTLEGISGTEQIRFSADGSWLLVPRFQEPYLVHVGTGRFTRVPTIGPVAWWPARSPSSLLLVGEPHVGPGGVPQPQLGAYDLATGTGESLGPIELPEQSDLDPMRAFPTHLDVSPDGTQALCATPFGPPGAFQEEHGSRGRVSLLDVERRRVEVVAAPFLGTTELEREHRSARWLGRAERSSFTLAPELEAGLAEPAHEIAPEAVAQVAGDIRNVAVLGLRALVDDSPEGSPHRLRPEVLRSLAAVHRLTPGETGEVDEWVDTISKHFAAAIQLEGCPLDVYDGWRKVIRAWERIKDPALGPIPWESDRLFEAP